MNQTSRNPMPAMNKPLPTAAVKHLLHQLENSRPVGLAVSGALLILVGLLDYLTGYEVGFALFYLFPVMLSTWTAGRWAGIATAALSAALWLATDFAAGHPYREPLSPFWNATMRLGIFVLVAHMVMVVRNVIEFERSLSRTDYLTGVANRRALTEALRLESIRSARFKRTFSLAYIDVDDFKKLNDTDGHKAGDEALCMIAATLNKNLRSVDLVGRIGGDEFAVLLPECGQDAAREAVNRCVAACSEKIRQSNWPISLSVGVGVFDRRDVSVDDMLAYVDEIMYRGKHSGKNSIHYGYFGEPGDHADTGQ